MQYKDFVKHEIDILYLVIEEKNKLIEKKEDDLGEYKMALRIPRQHYKHIEKLRFEEIKKQRDEIVAKLKKKYGIDPTKQMAQLKAPDPSLPPEQQFEMLTDGALVQQLAGKAPEPASKVSSDPKLEKIGASKSIVNLGGPNMQKNFSVASIMSGTTAASNFQSAMGEFSSVLSPAVRVGLFKNKRGGSVAGNPFQSQLKGSESEQKTLD